MRTDFVLDALEQALFDRCPQCHEPLVHHSDRGWQYVSFRYTEKLSKAGIEPSAGSRGDSYDNALTETINGLYKAELIHRRASLEDQGIRGTGHLAMGSLVQSHPTARTDWIYSTG